MAWKLNSQNVSFQISDCILAFHKLIVLQCHTLPLYYVGYFAIYILWTAMNHLKEKMQELNMYRSLLLQQISTIKMLCANKEESQVCYIM